MDDGTPKVEVIEVEDGDEYDAIYNHRVSAKKQSIASLLDFKTFNKLNDSSYISSSEIESGGKSEILYCRSSEKDKMSLEEFQMISMVGRGTFGKVFLVYSPVNKRYYALKSMRKDVLLN